MNPSKARKQYTPEFKAQAIEPEIRSRALDSRR
jgi:hypothetical protein